MSLRTSFNGRVTWMLEIFQSLGIFRILRHFGQAVSRLVWADGQLGQRAAVIIHMVVNTLGIADGRNFLNYSYPNLRPSTHLFKSETRCKDWTSWLVSAQKSKKSWGVPQIKLNHLKPQTFQFHLLCNWNVCGFVCRHWTFKILNPTSFILVHTWKGYMLNY